MALSSEQLADILREFSEPTRSNDKRRAARRELRSKINAATRQDGKTSEPFAITLMNVSCRGVGFKHVRKLDNGSQLVVYLPTNNGSLAMLCSVAFCRNNQDQTYTAGAEFICPLQDQKLTRVDVDAEALRIQKSMMS